MNHQIDKSINIKTEKEEEKKKKTVERDALVPVKESTSVFVLL